MFTRKPRKPLTFRRALLGALVAPVSFVLGFGGVSWAISTGALPVPATVVEGKAPDAAARPSEPAWAARADALSRRFECNATGLPEGVIPAHSVILDAHGRVRLASFDRGWQIFEGDAPGTLLRVCRK